MNEWVSVKDRLPPDTGEITEYIVFETLNNKVHHDYFIAADELFWNHYGNYVTHWMPLPEAPHA